MGIFKEFGINPILLLAQIVNFTILLLLLKKFLYQPVLKLLDERKQKVAQSLKDAEEIEKRLAATQLEQEKILDSARTEAERLIEESKKESKELSEKTIAAAKETVASIMKKNQEHLQLEKEQMMNQLRSELASLVVAATTKVSEKVMDTETNRKLVEQTISEVEKNEN